MGTKRLILEKVVDVDDCVDYVVHEHFQEGRSGRKEIWNLCEYEMERLFPFLKRMKIGHSVEVDVTIRPVGESAPWDEWEWKGG